MGSPRSEALKILIVEDELVVSMDLENTLKRLGYQIVASVSSGEEALREIVKDRPGLILMDVQLRGDMDGLTTAEVIHQQFDIPVIFVSANVSDVTIAKAKQSGSYGFLNKPFRPSELNATIEIALHQHHAGRKVLDDRERLQEQITLTSVELGQTREELQALSRHLMNAQDEERSRIARELHDDLGQQVAFLGMLASLLERDLPPDLSVRAATLRSGLDTLARDLREVSHKLHPSVIADLGLTDALESLVDDFRARGLAIRTNLSTAQRAPLDVSTSLYRIAQESLNNVLKHAPESSVRVQLSFVRTGLELRVSDDGQGFALEEMRGRNGMGLISMQERARLVGGELRLTTERGKGTTVLVRVPLAA